MTVGELAENPARTFQYPTVRRLKAEVLTDREMEDYLDAAQELGYLPIFLLALEQGLHQKELLALKGSDVDAKNRHSEALLARDGASAPQIGIGAGWTGHISFKISAISA